jgi:hypothetical protein
MPREVIMFRTIVATAILAMTFAAPALGQDDEEIIVTGSRVRQYDADEMPHALMRRRADYVIVALNVSCDTRDISQRRAEIREALQGLQQRAHEGAVTLALTDDDAGIVRPFTIGAADELIAADQTDRRPDTSHVVIQLRSPVSTSDTLESIHMRLARFVDQAPKPGRVQMELRDSQLVLTNPEQYRPALLRMMAADGATVAAMLGTGYGVQLNGLEHQVAWRRSGDLELMLFIPHVMNVAPVHE